MKIKQDKYRDKIEVWEGRNILATFSTSMFVEFTEVATQFILKDKRYKIVNESYRAKGKGMYAFHYFRGIVSAFIWDTKRRLKEVFKKKK